MTQREIILENLQGRHTTNWYQDKPYKSLGSVLHWLYVYTNLGIAETAIVGQEPGTTGARVTYRGEPFAHVYWDDELQMPIFVFLNHKSSDDFWKKEGTLLQKIYLEELLRDKN